MNTEDKKLRSAMTELFHKAAEQLGLKGELEITICKPPSHEKTVENHHRRKPRLPRRANTEIV